jgi:hypothetical protein
MCFLKSGAMGPLYSQICGIIAVWLLAVALENQLFLVTHFLSPKKILTCKANCHSGNN